MSETAGTLFALGLLILVYMLTRKWHAWRMKNTFQWIIEDLQKKGALDPDSAVHLPYSKMVFFRLGTRDYRPGALQYLVSSGLVGLTAEGRYYLKSDQAEALQYSREMGEGR